MGSGAGIAVPPTWLTSERLSRLIDPSPLHMAGITRHWWVRIVELPDGTDPASADAEMLRALLKREAAA
jgi:hypothetical protein